MTPKMTVVIPTCNRVEFLALSLEALARTSEAVNIDVRIFLDHTDESRLEEVDYVRDMYFPDAWIFHASEHVLAPSGCWNILHALKQGYETGADYIFLVEEDVLVYRDFFREHLRMQASGNYFATCGRLIPRHSGSYYTNPGACFKREKLAAVIPYITSEFFENRRVFMDRTFGQMDDASDLDDGLIRRVIRFVGGEVRYPEKAIVAHQGFHFYNHFYEYKTHGPIKDRVSQLREMLASITPAGRYTKDFEPFEDTDARL